MRKNKRLNKAEKRRKRNYLKMMSKNIPDCDCIQCGIIALAEGLSQVAAACETTLIELAQRFGDFFKTGRKNNEQK